ncbi:MAG TPA: Hint domain-containing protein [Puia sp.]|nr:Hint domain-containing protein [Puia sp.]
MKKILMTLFLGSILCTAASVARAQDKKDTVGARGLTLTEYERSKGFTVGDLDKDSYVKFENTYILDRNDFGKPYFITGDDGLKKRIDLYKLILKEGRVDLGTIIFYTTEKGQRYSACLPGFRADAKVWSKYFEDIHAIDKEEKNFVLKLSYVLSKELGFQLYRSSAAAQGKDPGKERESGTYGNEICFPGNMQVTLAGGSKKTLDEVRPGDEILAVDPATGQTTSVRVKELTVHEARNYAITELFLLHADEWTTAAGREVRLLSKTLRATPNHPMVTAGGNKKIGEIAEGEELRCLDERTGNYLEYTVWKRSESAGGIQKVFNIVAGGGSTFIMNDVMVLQKPLKN